MINDIDYFLDENKDSLLLIGVTMFMFKLIFFFSFICGGNKSNIYDIVAHCDPPTLCFRISLKAIPFEILRGAEWGKNVGAVRKKYVGVDYFFSIPPTLQDLKWSPKATS